MRGKRIIILSSLLFLLSWGQEALGEELQDLVSKIQARYEEITDLRADFTHTTSFRGFTTPFTSTGKFYIKKGGKMRWDYQNPSTQQIFVDGNAVLYYIPEHKQVIKTELSQETDSQLPLHLLAGTTRLSQEFDISFEETDTQKEAGVHLLRLIPRGTGGPQKILIEVEAHSLLIRLVSLFEPNSNISTFRFSQLETNVGLSDDLFSFTIPKGVDVVVPPRVPKP